MLPSRLEGGLLVRLTQAILEGCLEYLTLERTVLKTQSKVKLLIILMIGLIKLLEVCNETTKSGISVDGHFRFFFG